jgi:hypothetical protein
MISRGLLLGEEKLQFNLSFRGPTIILSKIAILPQVLPVDNHFV